MTRLDTSYVGLDIRDGNCLFAIPAAGGFEVVSSDELCQRIQNELDLKRFNENVS